MCDAHTHMTLTSSQILTKRSLLKITASFDRFVKIATNIEKLNNSHNINFNNARSNNFHIILFFRGVTNLHSHFMSFVWENVKK